LCASATLVGGDPKHLIRLTKTHFIILERTPLSVERHAGKIQSQDKQERERIARIFQQGLGSVVGYSLPIKRVTGGWMTGQCFCATMTRFG